MPIRRVTARCAALAVLALAMPTDSVQAQAESESRSTRAQATPAVRMSIFEGLSETQACMDMEDFACARERLDRLLAMRGLTGYETAQVLQAYGALHIAEENYPEAIVAFEKVLLQQDVPAALVQSMLFTIAQLYGQEQAYEKALDALERWFALAEAPSAEAWAMKARFLYLLGRYSETIEPARTALRSFSEQGKRADEGLYQVLQYSYLETDQPQSAIEVGMEIVGLWPKKQHVVTLAALYGQVGEELVQLALYEAAFEAGWLTSGAELSSYAQLLLAAEIPYKAATIFESGLESGVIESTAQSWLMLSQAWQLARDDERALPALERASALASDGAIDLRLAGAYSMLYRWEECVEAAGRAIDRGVDRTDEAHVQRGSCLVGLKRFGEAKEAFRTAARDPRSRDVVERWLQYVQAEEQWGLRMESMLEELRELARLRMTPAAPEAVPDQ